MSMDRWNPFREMDTMRQAMDRWFDDRVPGMQTSGATMNLAVDLHETENGYELTASIPGVKAEDVDITVNRDTITIRGKTERNEERQQGNYIYRERHSGSYQRTVRLPEAINSDEVEATLEHGILRLNLPRLQQTPNRRVQVRAGMMGNQPINQSSGTGNQVGLGQSETSGSGPGGTQTQQHPGMSPSSTTAQSGVSNTDPNLSGTGLTGGGVMHGAEAMNQSHPSSNTSSMQPGMSRMGNISVTPSSTTGSTGSSMSGGTGSMGNTQRRPEMLDNISSTQMDEIQRQARDNDEQGYRRLAQNYGWDDQTINHVWQHLTRRVTSEEANQAFGQQSDDKQQPGQAPTNSL